MAFSDLYWASWRRTGGHNSQVLRVLTSSFSSPMVLTLLSSSYPSTYGICANPQVHKWNNGLWLLGHSNADEASVTGLPWQNAEAAIIGLATSSDGLNFSPLVNLDYSATGTNQFAAVFGFTFFKDRAGVLHLIFPASPITGPRGDVGTFSMYEIHPTTPGNFTSWTSPLALTRGDSIGSYQDPAIVDDSQNTGQYFMTYGPGAGISYVASSASNFPVAVWNQKWAGRSGEWTGTSAGGDGPTIIKVGSTWYLVYETGLGAGSLSYITTPVSGSDWRTATPTWSGPFAVSSNGGIERTGSVFAIQDIPVGAPTGTVYLAATDRSVRTKPTLPTLGSANSIITDPTFGSRILRVSDASTQSGASIRSIGGAGNTLAWNTTSTYFITTNTSGGTLLWSFNATTMQATFVRSLNFNVSGVTFSILDPDVLYGFSTSYVEATVTKHTISTNSYATIVGVRTLVPTVDDAGRTYMRGVSVGSTGGVEYLSFIFGGTGQEYDHYAYWGPVNSIGSGKVLDTAASTINGSACSAIGMYAHAGRVEMSGRYVVIGPSTSVFGSYGSSNIPPAVVWDTTTNGIAIIDNPVDEGAGHGADGYAAQINFPDNSDGMESIYRSYATPHAFVQLISPLLSPTDFQIANHASWSNAIPSTLLPVIAAWYRYPTGSGPSSWVPSTHPWHEWDEEVVAVSTDGSHVVYRFCHHRSDTNNRDDATTDWFWSLPRPNVSRDGKWAVFTSNWDKTLGDDTGETSKRQDAFIVELLQPPPSSGPPPNTGTFSTMFTGAIR